MKMMSHAIARYWQLSILLCACSFSYAQFHPIMVQSQPRLIKLAIDIDANQAKSTEKIARIVCDNLNNSGQFLTWIDHNDKTAHYAAEFRVKMHLENASVLKLAWLPASRKQPDSASDLSLSPATQTSAILADQISDNIYQTITGKKGYFSTPIAYIEHKNEQYSLKISHINGLTQETLLRSNQPLMSPNWSPDGQNIAYVQFEKGYTQIHNYHLSDHQDTTLLAQAPMNQSPAFSPDGTRLLFVHPMGQHLHIFMYHFEDASITQITQGNQDALEPAWSNDGKQMYFTSNRDGSMQIYQLDFADQTISRISFEGNYNTSVCVMPDAGHVLWLHHHYGRGNTIMSFHHQVAHPIILQSAQGHDPIHISPQADWLIYGSRYGNHSILSMASIDGHRRMRLFDPDAIIYDPSWARKAGH